MKEKLLVSACLLGENCKYSGGNNYSPAAAALAERYELIPVCPERMGGLPTPRVPAERVGDRVLTRDGADVTAAYRLGAEKALEIALAQGYGARCFRSGAPPAAAGPSTTGPFPGRWSQGTA